MCALLMQSNLKHFRNLPTAREPLGLSLPVPLDRTEFRNWRVHAELIAKIISLRIHCLGSSEKKASPC